MFSHSRIVPPLNKEHCFLKKVTRSSSYIVSKSEDDPKRIVGVVVVRTAVSIHIAKVVAVRRISGTQPPIAGGGDLVRNYPLSVAPTGHYLSVLNFFLSASITPLISDFAAFPAFIQFSNRLP